MSHITECEVQVTDLTAFEKACRERGVELRREQKTFKNYNERRSPCDMAIAIPGNERAYEAGLVKTKDGKAYKIQVDNYQDGKGMVQAIGRDAGLLMQRYGINAARNAAVRQGMQVREQQLPDGSIRLICEPRQQLAQAGAGYGSGY